MKAAEPIPSTDQPASVNDVIVCPGCDILFSPVPVDVPLGSQLVCPRCSYRVLNPKNDSVNRTLALSLTGLLLFIPAHFTLLLQLSVLGLTDQGTVLDTIQVTYQQKYYFVALIVILTAMLIPLAKLILLFMVSLGISKKIFTKHIHHWFRWYRHLEEWGMTEVFLLGILITIIKMASMTEISYEFGFSCFIALSLALVACVFTLDKHSYWKKIEQLRSTVNHQKKDTPPLSHVKIMEPALSSGLVQCHTCHKVMVYKEPEPGKELYCPRCEGVVHKRIPNSISTTWALVLTALIFSFPANYLPIMEVEFLGSIERSTIMDGIIYFFQSGSWGIGIVILTASILVPVFKIIGLMILLYSIHFNRAIRLKQKSIMFRFIEFIGRWSMLDIFVIALLSALVDFGFFTRTSTAPAATFFTFVVLATMFAAISFDQRLIWDITTPQESMNK